MKKIIIIIGIVIILILLGVLFFINDGATMLREGIFSGPDIGDTTDNTIPGDIQNEEEDEQFVLSGPLTQLTTRPVVGYNIVQTSSTTDPVIYFAEAGTGHVYSIDYYDFSEVRISNTTIQGATQVLFSDDGQFAVFLGDSITVLSLPTASSAETSTFTLYETAESAAIIGDTLLYQVKENNSTGVKSYQLGSGLASERLFTIPFREAVVAWGSAINGPHFYYPKTASSLEGYLYSYVDGITNREPVSGFGLSAVAVNDSVLFTTSDDNQLLKSYSLDGTFQEYFIRSNPHKCAPVSATNEFICGQPETYESNTDKDRMIGTVATKDRIRTLGVSDASVGQILEVSEEAGISIDITHPVYAFESLLFTNKTTGNLWLYAF